MNSNDMLKELAAILESRKNESPDSSYVASLYARPDKMLEKIGEEAVETIIAAKALQTGDLPPTINLDNPDDGCDLNYVANEAQHRDIKYAMTNSFGFGGHNSSLVLGKV